MRACTFLVLLVQTSASEEIFTDDGLSLLQLRAGDNSVRHQSASPKTAQHSKVDDISLLGQVTSEQACRDLATQWGMKLGAFDTLGYGQKISSNMGSQLAGCWTYTGGPYACMAFYGEGGDEASQLAPPSNGGTAGPRSRLDATMQAQCAPDLAPGDDASATGDPHLTTNTGNHFDVSLLGEEEACGNCASGYTCTAGSIGVSRVQQIRDLGCGGEPDMWVCTVAKAKDACDADEKCNSFAVSDKWGLNKAQLFGASDGTPNAGWTLWSLDASAPECPPDADEASAAGDPHLITNTGEHYDYTTK